MTATVPLLSVDNLAVHFATKRGVLHAVDGVSLNIGEAETLGLVGETGSGKSVTARSLLRLVPTPPGVYAEGRVFFRPRVLCSTCGGTGCATCGGIGRIPAPCPACSGAGCPACESSGRETLDLLRVPERKLRDIRGNRIAMIFQDPGKALNPALSVRQQIAEVFAEHRSQELLEAAGADGDSSSGAGVLMRRAARGRSRLVERRVLDIPPFRSRYARLRGGLDDRIAEALKATRIPNPRKVMNSYPHELSGGMKQRVMIAQALACDPDLLIADEPTTALDVTIQARILDLIDELQEKHHTAVLYISHDLSLVRRISDRVAVMYGGKLAEVASTAQLFDDPLHPYTKALLSAIPSRGQRRGELVAIEGAVPEFIAPKACCRFHTRCPFAGPLCSSKDPALLERGREGHHAACFLYDSPDDVDAAPDLMPSWQGKRV
ncbi:MAG: ATP-binding cassette domain-containing protein [Actinobacteria bacterium]|nr:ATP-binding cassette domain-containing protein [Actinomycetota bacterium]